MGFYMFIGGLCIGMCGVMLAEYFWCKNQLTKGYSLEEIWEHLWGEHMKIERK